MPHSHGDRDYRGLEAREWSAELHFGSSTVSTRSTARFSSTCSRPLGQRTVSLSTLVARAQSEMNAPIVLREIAGARNALCDLLAARRQSISTRAPMPSRLLFVPFSWMVIQWFGVVLRRCAAACRAHPGSRGRRRSCRRCRSRRSMRRAPQSSRRAPARPRGRRPRICRSPVPRNSECSCGTM